ncbi:ac112/133-like protein [Alphabaculovirus altersperidaniae]|uniref:Ac112/133-like protein n=1 Tax=Spodoptera eridania nucleopolyhedrovirus TaxID=2315721 RepID=A0ABX6TQ34_9ABAC|nr:ac112/133-like protein [Spodoptera eridania nucleopolyhedrovirus]QNV47836.1 ac112/133-like protein [Spodoptera eridania nucleopolyhedrovirus]
MNAGVLCLAIDSVALNLRRLHGSVIRGYYCVDYELPLPDMVDLRNKLDVIRYNVEYLTDYAKNNLHVADIHVNAMVSAAITDELDMMLKNFTNQKDGDQKYLFIKTCQYVIMQSNNFNINNYLSHLKINKFHHVSTFVNMVNVHVLPTSRLFPYLIRQLGFLRRLCNKTQLHIAELNAVDALINMKQRQLPPHPQQMPQYQELPHQQQQISDDLPNFTFNTQFFNE